MLFVATVMQMKNQSEAEMLEWLDQLLSDRPQLLLPIYEMVNKRLGRKSFDIDFLLELNKQLLSVSCSQIRQDIFALSETGFKRDGYFVEFGAANGVACSNTYMLEKYFGWRGILAEPALAYHDDLMSNRNCHIETGCVWRDTGETLLFNETEIEGLSTIAAFSDLDMHKDRRKQGLTYPVTTISLNDLLAKYNAPDTIDYLSIDTEGSEYEILQNFDFGKYHIQVITCEHNYTSAREKIHALLVANGYVRKYDNISQFDDWYVRV